VVTCRWRRGARSPIRPLRARITAESARLDCCTGCLGGGMQIDCYALPQRVAASRPERRLGRHYPLALSATQRDAIDRAVTRRPSAPRGTASGHQRLDPARPDRGHRVCECRPRVADHRPPRTTWIE
jgi:hypothetical protein